MVDERAQADGRIYRAAVAERCAEKVVAVALMTHPHAVVRHGHDPIPGDVLVAVTPSHVRCFAVRARGFSLRAGDEVAAWPRAGLGVEAVEEAHRTRVLVTPAGGDTIELDAGPGSDGLHAEVVAALSS